MGFLRNSPIRKKLVLITMITSAAALLLACASFLAYERIVFRKTMVRDLTGTAHMIADNSSAALSFHDPASAKETLGSLTANPNIVGAAIYDKNGKVFATYQRDGATFRPPAAAFADGERFEPNRFKVSRQIEHGGEPLGTLYLESDLEQLHALLVRYFGIVGLVLGFATLVSYLLAQRLCAIVSRPISHLAEVAQRVGENADFSVRARKQSNDEMGQLIDSFNHMLDLIQQHDRALEQSRQELERRVDERTRALLASERRMRLIVDTAFDAIVTVDGAGVVIAWNKQAQSTFGWAPEEAIGRHLADLILPAGSSVATLFEAAELKESKPVEITALRKDRTELPIEAAVTQVLFGTVVIYSAFLRDISSRKQAEARLEIANRELVDASHRAGMAEVATGVLHNVGNVLNSVNVSATLLADSLKNSKMSSVGRIASLFDANRSNLATFISTDPKGAKIPDYLRQLADHLDAERQLATTELDQLRRNIEHIKDIVAMQQSYARVSGITETLDVTELIEDSLRLNAAALLRHGVTVTRDYKPLPLVTVEKHKVLQILVNIIRNAKYACDESGRADKQLTIRTFATRDTVAIQIADNGIGIAPENLTRIFAHGFTTRITGHGFGLHSGAIAARELGGTLRAESDGPGLGATFTLELPLSSTPAPKSDANGSPAPGESRQPVAKDEPLANGRRAPLSHSVTSEPISP